MSDQFIVRHPIAKNDGTTIEPRSKPYSLSDFKGVNLEFLMSVKSVVPVGGSVPRNLLVDVENASKEELLEENRRLQAALEGSPTALPAEPTSDYIPPIKRIGPRARSTADLQRDPTTGEMNVRHSPESQSAIMNELASIKETVSALYLLVTKGETTDANGQSVTIPRAADAEELAMSRQTIEELQKENGELRDQLMKLTKPAAKTEPETQQQSSE